MYSKGKRLAVIGERGRGRDARSVRRASGVGVLTAALLCVVACSSTSKSAGSGTTGGSSTAGATLTTSAPTSEHLAPLTVDLASTTPYVAYYLADELGYFSDEGLKVTLNGNKGISALTDLASGRADLIDYPAPSILLGRQHGINATLIYTASPHGSAAISSSPLMTAPKVSLEQLQAKSSCKLATYQPGSGVYLEASLYVKYVVPHCSIISEQTIPLVIAAVASGEAQAGVVTANDEEAAEKKGIVHIVLDPSITHQSDLYLPYLPFVATSGLASNLQSKRASVVAFLKALHRADDAVATQPVSALATALHKNPAFFDTSVSTLEATITAFHPGPNWSSWEDEEIAQPDWEHYLTIFPQLGISSLSPTAASASYAKAVDMSYAQAAEGG